MSLTFEYTYPISFDIYNRMLLGDSVTGQVGTPEGEFYLNKGLVVPFSYIATNFTLKTDNLDDPVSIKVSRTGSINNAAYKSKSSNEFIIYPVTDVNATKFITTVPLQLGQGKNEILASQNTETVRFIVTATHFSSILLGYSEELFNYSIKFYLQQRDAIYSPTATRLAEPLLDIGSVLPDVTTLQKIAMKIATRVYTSESASQIGVQDFLSGLIQSTPYFRPQKNVFDFEPSIIPIFRRQEDFSGNEAHVWIPNVAITNWVGFIKFINNMNNYYDLLKVTENEVIVSLNGEVENHRFDFDAQESFSFYLDRERACYDNFNAYTTLMITFDIVMCAATYTLDLFIDENSALFGFDVDEDNFIGFSLTGRLDGGYALDTSVVASPDWSGSVCVYPDGYYTQAPVVNETQIEIIETITATTSLTISALGEGFGLGGFGNGEFGV